MDKIKCIYAIKDKRNDKVIYVGFTKNFKERKHRHFTDKKLHIDNYMFDEGRNNFLMIIIEEFNEDISKDDMKMKEQNYIEKFNTIKTGFNKRNSGNKNFQEQHQKEYRREYKKTEKSKEYHKEYYRKDYWKEYQRQYYLKNKINKINNIKL